MPRSAENARLILTPSEFTRRTVIERLNIDASVVRAVPHGISPREDRVEGSDVRERFGLDGPFFLYPAATYPHKNHLTLLDAFKKLLNLHPDAYLVLTGAAAHKEWVIAKQMGERIEEEIKRLGIDERVKRLGYVASRDLDALYQEAVALTMVSRFEGFGAPCLEAMSRGCPVIGSNATAIPEVVEDSGILCSPDNSDEWCDAMSNLIEDHERRTQLAKSGQERALEFTWSRSAEVLEDSYRFVMETAL